MMTAVPTKAFRGANIMTPHILERGVLYVGVYYELSTDDGDWARNVEHSEDWRDRPLIGVTIRDSAGEDVGPGPTGYSRSFRSLAEARAYLDERAAEGGALTARRTSDLWK